MKFVKNKSETFLFSLVFWVALFFISFIQSVLPKKQEVLDLSSHFHLVRQALNDVHIELMAVCIICIFLNYLVLWGYRPFLPTSWKKRKRHTFTYWYVF